MEPIPKNYYYFKNNQKISQYISHIIESYIKSKPNQILLLNPIFIREDNSSLVIFFTQLNSPCLYLTLISLMISNENKFREIKIEFKKENKFLLGENMISNDKKHLVLFNENKNKAYIILNFIDQIIIKNSNTIELKENNYFEIEKGNILDIKFNKMENNDETIIYAIYCNNNKLSIFNNKYMNKEFQIFLNNPIIDFQIIKKGNEYNLFLLDKLGNFRYIKNIQDVKNLPKSDESNLLIKIEILDKILFNISNINTVEFKKCYLQNFDIDNNTNITSVIRTTDNFLDLGILINDKLFIIKKYNLEKNNEEKIDKIIPINNDLNKYLIKSDKNLYLLDIPSLLSLFLSSSLKENKNNQQDILLIINEIISKINLNLILKLPSHIDNKIFSINYNFYNGNILCIKIQQINVIIKVYDFEIENFKNNNILKLEENNNKLNDTKIIMTNLLASIEQEKEIFMSHEIIKNKKEEYYNKILEEIYSNINLNMNMLNTLQNNNNINHSIELLKDWYINAYTNIKLYGELIKSKYNLINNNIEKCKSLSDKVKKSDDIVINLKKNIENKYNIIKQNENVITQLKKDNNNLINDFYIMNSNDNKNEKNFSNELIKRTNNFILKNIQYVEQNLKNNNELFNTVNFEQMKNFPLTMKYLDESQKEKISSLIDSINNLVKTFINFHEKIKEKK